MDINRIPRNQLGVGSHIALEPCETEHDLYWKMAIEVLEVIAENNKRGEPTVMIVPYGPVGPYARLAWLVNKYRLSLKNCYFANMDEYLDEDGQWMDKNHPFSFRGGMERSFYNLVDPELNVPESQRRFPEPGHEEEIWNFIQENGAISEPLLQAGSQKPACRHAAHLVCG